MKKIVALAFLAILSGCTTVDINRLPPEDFPNLLTRTHYVAYTELRERCDRYASFWIIPSACMEWNFDMMTCDMWFNADNPPFAWQIKEEELHCKGYDHTGDSTLRDAWEQYKRGKP